MDDRLKTKNKTQKKYTDSTQKLKNKLFRPKKNAESKHVHMKQR